ncbi:MAG: YjbH domain-containing protein [Moraxellaceae bacterium]|nr:YjbH domain-containing protein [Moraxellaceae bacterium]MDZ4386034.1 YjbH domain-containing protein [Moraxellaceae bacterium]
MNSFKQRHLLATTFALALLPATVVQAEPMMTYGAWGGAGLLQTPTARFGEAGEINLTLSNTDPYTRLNVMLQPFDWLEAGFRYIDIKNVAFGISTTGQSTKDKSIDARIRLLQESEYLPQLALGLRDLGGTGLFSSEYVVANKRFGDVDVSLGVAWGYMGARGDFDGFGERTRNDDGTGGKFNTSSYFRGPAGIIGGLAWFVPNTNFVAKVELDGNDYESEPFNNNQTQNSPVNVGLAWRATPNLELNVGFERGDTAQFGFTLHSNFRKLQSQPKLLDPSPEPVRPISVGGANLAEIAKALTEQTGVEVSAIHQGEKTIRVEVEQNNDHQPARVVDRAARVLHNRLPPHIEWFSMQVNSRGMDVINYDIRREAFVRNHTQPSPTPNGNDVVFASAPASGGFEGAADSYYAAPKRFDGGLGLNYSQNIGGPDAFILYQLNAELAGEWRMAPNVWVAGALNYRIVDNYDEFNFTAPSNLPRVRTFLREYLTTNELTLPNLQVTATSGLGQDWYGMVYGGLLETMFAGAGGEVLYRPSNSRFAFGIDANYVQQRDFEQDFGLRDYKVATGHVTLYAKTGFEGVLAQVKVGRYLAGDIGTTIDLSREFRNGVRIGAYATFTDVSSEEFGEGSFDKGMYVLLPLDLLLPTRTRSIANLTYSPLTRDGGARLNRRYTLYDLTQDKDTDRLFGNMEWLKP